MKKIYFDSKALYKALETKKTERNMTWKQVASEIGVAESTITRTQQGGRMEVDGMLAMVSWLGVQVEFFIRKISE